MSKKVTIKSEIKDPISDPNHTSIKKCWVRYILENPTKKAVIIGICHGAQFLSTKYNSKIIKCKNHTSPHGLKLKRHFFKNKIFKSVKSHHEYKITKINKFEITSTANDLSIESFINVENKLIGFMWHPERQKDANIQKKIFLKHFNLINSNLPKNKKF